MTNFCFEIRASSDLDEVKMQKKHPKPIWIKFRLMSRTRYLFISSPYFILLIWGRTYKSVSNTFKLQ